MNINWDAKKYTENFAFVHEYGKDVLQLLNLEAGMSVLDLGCGNGALTRQLCDMGMKAYGIDASEHQILEAKSLYPDLEFHQADAACFTVLDPVDAVFSNAVFHWIEKERQPQVLDCVYRALKPGGQFVFEMGGLGNTCQIHGALEDAFQRRGRNYTMPFYFPSIGEYGSLVESAGFRLTMAMLFPRLTPLKGEDGMAGWIRQFIKVPFQNMEEKMKEEIVCEAAESLRENLYRDGTWYADYVRLRCRAVKITDS